MGVIPIGLINVNKDEKVNKINDTFIFSINYILFGHDIPKIFSPLDKIIFTLFIRKILD
tara:strand:+ start:400 stop:576 length:177 start_codon:yes stop_codon:yes gene_type:complete